MKVTVQVKPNSKKGSLVQPSLTGELLVYVKEPARDGEANRAVINLVAKYYNVPKTRVQIIRGGSSRHKVLEVDATIQL